MISFFYLPKRDSCPEASERAKNRSLIINKFKLAAFSRTVNHFVAPKIGYRKDYIVPDRSTAAGRAGGWVR